MISGINRELLDQLPALAQQQAIVLGDCVALPLQVRINTVDPARAATILPLPENGRTRNALPTLKQSLPGGEAAPGRLEHVAEP